MLPDYYESTDTMLMWLPVVGSTFKKVYTDPVTGRPVSDFIPPDQVVVDMNAVSITKCSRITHIIPMTDRDLRARQLAGFYRDIEIDTTDYQDLSDARSEINFQIGIDPQTGEMRTSSNKTDDVYKVCEIHADIDLAGYEHMDEKGEPSGLPLPYIVTVDYNTKKV